MNKNTVPLMRVATLPPSNRTFFGTGPSNHFFVSEQVGSIVFLLCTAVHGAGKHSVTRRRVRFLESVLFFNDSVLLFNNRVFLFGLRYDVVDSLGRSAISCAATSVSLCCLELAAANLVFSR